MKVWYAIESDAGFFAGALSSKVGLTQDDNETNIVEHLSRSINTKYHPNQSSLNFFKAKKFCPKI